MSNESHDKTNHWRNKLDELDSLPNETGVDKTAAWDNLHGRLRGRSKLKKIGWYWWAAAVIICIGLTWRVTNRQQGSLVKEENQPASRQILPKPSKTNMETGSTLTNPIVKPGSQHSKSVIVKTKAKAKLQSNDIANPKIPIDPPTIEVKQPEIVVSNTVPEDTIQVVPIALAPVKKKLRVVHVNELESSARESSQYAKMLSPIPSQPKLYSQGEFAMFNLGKNTSDNILKIKLSPSN